MICVNDEHSENADDSIEVTNDGIVICVSDKHPLEAPSQIEVKDDEIFDMNFDNNFCFSFDFWISLSITQLFMGNFR